MTEGLDELCNVLTVLNSTGSSNVIADLSVARGFDYYTGTVCEGKFADFPKYPTVVAGGRYDNLVSDRGVKLPGVGMSLGVTRILGLVLHEGLVQASRKTPACVLVALVSEQQDNNLHNKFTATGILKSILVQINTETDRVWMVSGIPYVCLIETGDNFGEVRDLRTREQVVVIRKHGTQKSCGLLLSKMKKFISLSK